MSSKKSHREKLARQVAAENPPPETAAPIGQGWPRERYDMEAFGKIERDGVRGFVIGRVFQNEDGSVFAKFPEGTKLVDNEIEFSYEAMPAQDATEEPDTGGGSRYKRDRRWWEQSRWERTR
jgi:hypothetical protein